MIWLILILILLFLIALMAFPDFGKAIGNLLDTWLD